MLSNMFGFLKRMVGADDARESAADQPNEQLAAAALLVAIARRDDDYADSERLRISAAVERLFALEPDAAAALQAKAEDAQSAALDLHQFTHVVKNAYTMEERVIFMEAAWAVVLADGRRDPEENALMRQLVGLLGMEDRHSVQARRRAETEARGGAEGNGA